MTTKPFDLFILAGEDSGDILGERLLLDFKKSAPDLKIKAVAGPRMRRQNPKQLFPMEKLQTMGFWDVLLALPRLVRHFFKVKKWILENQPKAAVLIDYPGFNLRLERSLRKKGFQGKLIHYVCPTVWAHGKGRIKLMEKNLDLLLTIFPFEKGLFKKDVSSTSKASFKVHYVGHPLLEKIENYLANYPNSSPQFQNQKKQKTWVGLFPGSREKEIALNLPIQLQALKAVYPEKNFELFISVSHPRFKAAIEKLVQKNYPYQVTYIAFAEHYALMPHLDLAIAKSGTINLELAFFEVPTCVTFKIRRLELLIARDILRIRLPFYCMVNILQNKLIFPELYGPNLTKENLIVHLKNFLAKAQTREKIKKECLKLKNDLRIDKDRKNLNSADAILASFSEAKSKIFKY